MLPERIHFYRREFIYTGGNLFIPEVWRDAKKNHMAINYLLGGVPETTEDANFSTGGLLVVIYKR